MEQPTPERPAVEADDRAWGSPEAERGRPFPGLIFAGLSGVTTLWLHARFLAADASFPVGDAAGHLLNVARARLALHGVDAPAQAFPPGVYTVSALVVDRLGPTVDHAALGVALFGALLSATVSWLGWRASGAVAAVLLPLLVLSTPMLTATSRVLLLDLPATACIVAVWVLLWESRAFRRAGPTVLLGAALAAGALVKYTLLVWVLPPLLLAGALFLLRAPAALLPLAAAVPAVGLAASVLAERAIGAAAAGGSSFAAVMATLGATALVQAGLLGVARSRGESRGWRAGVGQGAWLALAALLCVALVFPWFHHAMPMVWAKVRREALDEVRTSVDAVRFAQALLISSWPRAWALVQVGLVAEVVAVGLALTAVLRGTALARRPRAASIARRLLDPGPVVGPIGLVAVASAAGAWLTMRSLPNDARYYLPLLAGAAIVVGLGACRLPALRWTLGVGLALVAARRLAVAEGLVAGEARRVSIEAFAIRPVLAAPRAAFAAPAPASGALAPALERLAAAIAARSPAGGCGDVLLAVPHFLGQRALGFEARGLAALVVLSGAPECALTEWGPGAAADAKARWLAVAGIPTAGLDAVLARAPRAVGEALAIHDAGALAVRLYALDDAPALALDRTAP